MALTAGIQLNHFIFQLVALDVDPNSATYQQGRELLVRELVVKPESIQYNYNGRNVAYQTAKAIFLDKFSPAPVRISFRGTFGKEARREGLVMKDGHTRMIEFRESMTKGYWTELSDEEMKSLLGLNVTVKDTEVVVINFYDFWHNERYQVDIQRMRTTSDTNRHVLLSFYDFQLLAIGKPVPLSSPTKNATLWFMQEGSALMERATGQLNSFASSVQSNEIYQAAEWSTELVANLPSLINGVVQSAGPILQTLKGGALKETYTTLTDAIL